MFKIGDEVKCIDNKGAEDMLELGQVYKIIYFDGYDRYQLDGVNGDYNVIRFELEGRN